MDASCPSLPPKILVADKVRPNEQTTVYMAAHGCHFVECFWYVLLVIIESVFLAVRESFIARTFLYKVSIAIVSRSFYRKTITAASIRFSFLQLLVIHRAQFSLDHIVPVLQDWTEIGVAAIWSNNRIHYA